MKPKEFDELIRQKFDQNDFAYKSGSWDELAEKLEGRAKKRSVIMWWWVPLAGMAASVALAMGVTTLLKQNAGMQAVSTEVAQRTIVSHAPVTIEIPTASSHKEAVYALVTNKHNKKAITTLDKNVSDWFHVRLNDAPAKPKTADNGFNFLADNNNSKTQPKAKKEQPVVAAGYNTFSPEEQTPKKAPKLSVTLLGGYNQGNQTTGYMAGGTIRKMLNDKVYIESDVAFSSSNNTQTTEYLAAAGSGAKGIQSGAKHSGAKTTNIEASKISNTPAPAGVIKTEEENYNLYYAQVSPSIGYKVIKKVAIGVGPDFQRMLVDNRPATSTVDRGNIQVAPLFDVGLVGKTEYSLTKRVKAAVSYRKGINNFITPMDKYIDRDYLQFQIRCTIFNK